MTDLWADGTAPGINHPAHTHTHTHTHTRPRLRHTHNTIATIYWCLLFYYNGSIHYLKKKVSFISSILKPQDSFGEFYKFFLDLQKVQEIMKKHNQTFLQLFGMTYCNAILHNGSYHYVHNLWQSVRGDSEHFYVLVISWKWKHFEANC